MKYLALSLFISVLSLSSCDPQAYFEEYLHNETGDSISFYPAFPDLGFDTLVVPPHTSFLLREFGDLGSYKTYDCMVDYFQTGYSASPSNHSSLDLDLSDMSNWTSIKIEENHWRCEARIKEHHLN